MPSFFREKSPPFRKNLPRARELPPFAESEREVKFFAKLSFKKAEKEGFGLTYRGAVLYNQTAFLEGVVCGASAQRHYQHIGARPGIA